MTTAQMLELAKETLEQLPPEQLKVAAEFLTYLDERASNEATEELLKIPGLLEDVDEAKREFDKGGGTSWREVRQDV
jgi:predicted Zn-dependent protease with MMP-like domain